MLQMYWASYEMSYSTELIHCMYIYIYIYISYILYNNIYYTSQQSILLLLQDCHLYTIVAYNRLNGIEKKDISYIQF